MHAENNGHITRRINETEDTLKRHARQLAQELEDVAEHGTHSFHYSPSGVLRERAIRLDSLCAALSELDRMRFACGEVTNGHAPDPEPVGVEETKPEPEPKPPVEPSPKHAPFVEQWKAHVEEFEQYVSRRQYTDAQLGIELVRDGIKSGDWATVRESLDDLLAFLKDKPARRYIQQWRVHVHKLLRLLDKAEG